ncbi:SURF1 family protein [Mobilicoccus pelagius]|uniref:SURF1-like protein n=1 Tax=Mobilicoccus pelagius NBRC 104925 TaxID=1089455 RepID=H5UU65_9MICO|nr:SURF1 family protein [Mobilicoccus pelagius]GAB49273.1 hypothetical protein MOPEL_099_00730 [Mobilicoccus pelagius NBRC 104925]
MIRTALRPKWLALLGLVLVVVVGFGWLGLWQLDVAQHAKQQEVLDQIERTPEAPVDEVLPPQTSITGHHVGRSVRATGRYDAAHQVLVVDRRLGDRLGAWVLTPLVVDSTGARLAVVRGFVDAGVPAPPAPSGTVTVHGSLQPQEGPPEKFVPQEPGRVQTVDLASGVNRWGGDIYNAFVFASSEEPPATGASAKVAPVPPPAVRSEGVNWRNAAYAVQWWIFAGFVVYIWWRAVRDEHEIRLAAGGGTPGPSAADSSASTDGAGGHVGSTVAGATGVDHPANSSDTTPSTPAGGSSR